MKNTIVSFTDIPRDAYRAPQNIFRGTRFNVSRALGSSQLLYLVAYFAIVDVDTVDLSEHFERAIDLADFFITCSDFEPQRLVFIFESVRYFQPALEPHYRDLGNIFLLEAHTQHIAAVHAVTGQVFGAGRSKRNMEFRDRLVEQLHILERKSQTVVGLEIDQRLQIAGLILKLFKDLSKLVTTEPRTNRFGRCKDRRLRFKNFGFGRLSSLHVSRRLGLGDHRKFSGRVAVNYRLLALIGYLAKRILKIRDKRADQISGPDALF